MPLTLVAAGVGVLMYRRAGQQSDTAADTMALGSAVFWIIAGVFAIMGGFVILGFAFIAIFTFIGLGKFGAVRDHYQREVRDRRA
jgi:hypothetical protein